MNSFRNYTNCGECDQCQDYDPYLRTMSDVTDEQIDELYLEYSNDYLTTETMAEHNDMCITVLHNILESGRLRNHARKI